MSLTSFLMFFKVKQVKWTLVGILLVFAGLPLIFNLIPRLLYSKIESGSYLDVVEMKEISKLSVQRLNFSNVVTATWPTNTTVSNATVYVRRIMRGHVTTSLDFSRIVVTNSSGRRFVVEFPKLDIDPIIDKWVFYDSKGTGDRNTRNLTNAMDKNFREEMMKEALKPERVARAKKRAEDIIQMLYPDMTFESKWPQDPNTGTQSTVGEAAHE